MFKTILSILLIIVLVLSFASCTSEVSAQQIVNGVIETPDKINTFQYDMNMTINMNTPLVGGMLEEFISMDASAIVDVDNKLLRMNMLMSVLSNGVDVFGTEMEYYLVENMMYAEIDVPDMGPMWVKARMPIEYWTIYDQVESQIELLKDAQETTLIGSETINGIDCYVLEITPDMEKLWEITMQQSELAAEETLPGVNGVQFKEVFKDFSMKQWIAKDTYYMTKAEIKMSVNLYPDFAEDELAKTMDITIDLSAYNYNLPVSIVLPAEAMEAIEVPLS